VHIVKWSRIQVALLVFLVGCQGKPEPTSQQFLNLGIMHSFAPMDGVYCSGQPTPEQFDKLKDIGVTRVVSLRLPTEDGTGWEEAEAQKLGIEFVRIPVAGEAGLTLENTEAMAKQLEGVRGPVLVACGSSNRVGALFALKARFLDGKSPAEAIAVGKACGMTRAEAKVSELVSQ